jgi:hypothetical protein
VLPDHIVANVTRGLDIRCEPNWERGEPLDRGHNRRSGNGRAARLV